MAGGWKGRNQTGKGGAGRQAGYGGGRRQKKTDGIGERERGADRRSFGAICAMRKAGLRLATSFRDGCYEAGANRPGKGPMRLISQPATAWLATAGQSARRGRPARAIGQMALLLASAVRAVSDLAISRKTALYYVIREAASLALPNTGAIIYIYISCASQRYIEYYTKLRASQCRFYN